MTTKASAPDFEAEILQDTGLHERSVRGTLDLLKSGNTIPFIARYRKEATGGLDETQIRDIEDRLQYFTELNERKSTILKTIEEQGKLTPELEKTLRGCRDKKRLEDLYLPYKPKRRTRAIMAKEKGLAPLADLLAKQESPPGDPEEYLQRFVNPDKGVASTEEALKGACDILAETWAETPDIRAWVRVQCRKGDVFSKVKKDWKDKSTKFDTYYDYAEAAETIPSHRYLAIRRGEAEGILMAGLEVDEESIVGGLRARQIKNRDFVFRSALEKAVDDGFRRLLFPSIQSEILATLKDKADQEAIEVFAKNLCDLLLAAPAGPKVVLGMDPGFRTGCKIAVIDETGKFLETTTIFPVEPQRKILQAAEKVESLIERHGVQLIAIGNGTASRETEHFVDGLLKKRGDRRVSKVMVNESGASIYSASDVAREEFPDLDLTVRGAISIARRLQDPLAELVKIDAKSIGVGQYQHDVNQVSLKRALDREVESCVNSVGVDLNTASKQLLGYVAGIGPKLADSIVKHREEQGAFPSRKGLLKVPRFGAKAFEQCAGFMRVAGSKQPLDNSAVHPESYYVVEGMAKKTGLTSMELIGNKNQLSRLNPQDFVDDKVGLPTVKDIIEELEKPGRDPRQEFRMVQFSEGVEKIGDLEPGMTLEGVVTNVTHFGAFVDIGVHQDGLVHISELDNRFVEDPSDVVSVGDIFQVKVLEIDLHRKRIALSRKQVMR